MSSTPPNPLLKPLKNLYRILAALSKVPAFCNEELLRDLKAAREAISQVCYTQKVRIKRLPRSVGEKINNIADNKGITTCAFLRAEINKILSRPLAVIEKQMDVEVYGVPTEKKYLLDEMAVKSGFTDTSDFMRDELLRIIREAPAHLLVKRM